MVVAEDELRVRADCRAPHLQVVLGPAEPSVEVSQVELGAEVVGRVPDRLLVGRHRLFRAAGLLVRQREVEVRLTDLRVLGDRLLEVVGRFPAPAKERQEFPVLVVYPRRGQFVCGRRFDDAERVGQAVELGVDVAHRDRRVRLVRGELHQPVEANQCLLEAAEPPVAGGESEEGGLVLGVQGEGPLVELERLAVEFR